MQSDQKMIQDYVDNMAQDAEEYLRYDSVGEEREEHSADSVLDLRYLSEQDGDIIGVQIQVTAGGPNVWIDTHREKVVGWWGSAYAEADVPSDIAEELYDEYREYGFSTTLK